MTTITISSSSSVKPRAIGRTEKDNARSAAAVYYPDDDVVVVGAVFVCLNPLTLSVISQSTCGDKSGLSSPWLISIVALPFSRVEAAPSAVCDDTFVIFVLRLPFAVAVTSTVVLGDGDGDVTLKFKVAFNIPLSVALPESATA